jgi:hypothetical protein
VGFSEIDFLPEPFAAFQYYRHGLRHPLVAQRAKQHVLVIDFGGGSCDVCVIETTKEGEISQTGRHSRPLAAGSRPIGGFFINRVIAENLLYAHLPATSHAKIGRGLECYVRWRRAREDPSMYSVEYQRFVRHFHRLIHGVENPKLSLCRSILDWSLNAPANLRATVALPIDPFREEPGTCNAGLSATRLRDVFVEKVWKRYLRPLIEQTLNRGKEELAGAPISLVLMSGGSANIGWLAKLIDADFGSTELLGAEILPLPDFQEVVAKGLAVECARRHYSPAGDFSSVTYNRLCLVLGPDEHGHEVKQFTPKTEGLPKVQGTPGLLLPSASILQNFIDQPLKWKVKLDHPPRHGLGYYFLRSSFDPADIENLQNIEEQTAYTPPGCSFDAALQVELLVKQDGTAIPNFVYKTGRTETETIARKGKNFYLDMTYVKTGGPIGDAYIGLDFGTSNSSVSYVDQSSVQLYEHRAEHRQWLELNELVQALPYPLAAPLGRYLGQTDVFRLTTTAFNFVEAALALASYAAYVEYCTADRRSQTRLFKGLAQRSAGPLWQFLKQCVKHSQDPSPISRVYSELFAEPLLGQMDAAVTSWSQVKHEKLDERTMDVLRPVQILGNISNRVFSKYVFGFFEGVQKQKYSPKFHGSFRHAHGRPPFTTVSRYEGDTPFAEAEAVLANLDSGEILPLQPLVFWESCEKHPDVDPPGHCYLFDSPLKTQSSFSFKAAAYSCSCEVSDQDQYRTLANQVAEFRQSDPVVNAIMGSFTSR